MKIKVLSRDPEEHTRSRKNDIYKIQRNYDPALHPFQKAREYTRALNATKLDKIFAKPFIGNLHGHIDGVYSMAKNVKDINSVASGSADGELILWELSERKIVKRWRAHEGFVRGICFNPQEKSLVSCGDDKTVKLWQESAGTAPVSVFTGKSAFLSVDHHRTKSVFATSGQSVELWDHSKPDPIASLQWGAETISCVRFNQTEVSVFASCSNDRAVVLYDIRTSVPLAKMYMKLKSNSLCWNPMEAFNFTVANEDHNCYTFDMRKMSQALNVHKDHASAVLDIDYSPTGQEFVTGSYDKSIRIFPVTKGTSREVYHTKRMQHAFCVKYSMDSKYILSGSDDGNIRIWKSIASEQIGPLSTREQRSRNYQNALKERFKHMPEIKRISQHKLTPKAIKTAQATKRTILESEKRRKENRKKHSREGTVVSIPERKKAIITVEQ